MRAPPPLIPTPSLNSEVNMNYLDKFQDAPCTVPTRVWVECNRCDDIGCLVDRDQVGYATCAHCGYSMRALVDQPLSFTYTVNNGFKEPRRVEAEVLSGRLEDFDKKLDEILLMVRDLLDDTLVLANGCSSHPGYRGWEPPPICAKCSQVRAARGRVVNSSKLREIQSKC